MNSTTSNDRDNCRLALQFQKEGRYKEAIALAYQISDPAARAGILVDSGGDLRRPKLVREGIALFQSILKSDQSTISRASLLYNIANGYSAIYDIRRRKNPRVAAPNDDDLRMAKKMFREAQAEIKGVPSSLRSQILVNYGNCLSMLGRSVEAIQAYQAALEAEPQNGMAAGNLGVELDRIAQITGRYTHHYLLVAREYLRKACSPEMHLSYGGVEATRGFQEVLNRIQEIIDAHREGIPPLRPVVLPKSKKAINQYIRFCLKNHLFLNAWVGDQDVMPAMVDEIAFGPITVRRRKKGMVSELLRILNEIKEAFSTARYLFYLSQLQSVSLDDVSRITSYFDLDVEDLHGLYIGLCKSAYMRAFDVLDKIARIVNVYFGIGKRTDYFWHIFAERQSRGESHELRFVARSAIIATYNYSLYALSDLCIDYFESEHLDLRNIDVRRNQMTHDYLAVPIDTNTTLETGENEITLSELKRQTLTVLRLAKLAILYVVSSVSIAENQKEPPATTLHLKWRASPGHTAKAVQPTMRS